MYVDDHRGVGEALNETDSKDDGITVTSNYYLQLFDKSYEESE
jgi:hypothetical protein